MNDEQFDDLKQYISGVVGQSEKRLEKNLGGRMDKIEGRMDSIEGRMDSIEQKLDASVETLTEAIERIHDVTDNHEKRIIKLETKPA